MNHSVTILQLTDLHLLSDSNCTVMGMNPLHSFQAVIEHVRNNPITKNPDLIVVTGDISQDYSLGSYQHAYKLLKQFDCPVIGTTGNHDNPESFSLFFGKPTLEFTELSHLTNWRILLVSSYLSQCIVGKISEHDLAFLQNSLATNNTQPVIMFTHHHLLPIHSKWMDNIRIANAKDFINIVDRQQNLKAVVCGHTHQATSADHRKVKYLTTPATSWQFAPRQERFKAAITMPGYRWIKLHQDNSIETKVERIKRNPKFLADPQAPGY